jgi:hypothetical protein
MNFNEWWATLTPAEQKVIGRTNAKFVWLEACESCTKVCEEAQQRYKELWDKFSYDEDEGRMLGAMACSAAIKAKEGK